MIINGRYASEGGGTENSGDECSVNGGIMADFYPNVLKSFLENIDRRGRGYLECGNQISPKSSPLQGMKAQPLQSLFLDKLTSAPYQPCSLFLNSL